MSGIADQELFGAVRWALEKDPRIKSADLIQLSVENGVVQIWGEVESAAEKAAAEEVARGQRGAKDVVNALTVVMAAPFDSESALRAAVEKALSGVRGARLKDIGVQSASRGTVRLVGHAGSLAEERAAIGAAAAVPGVREVVSEVVIGEVPRREAVAIFDDAAIKSMVNGAIAERGVTIYEEDTAVADGVVYLRGRVLKAREVQLAEQVAAAVAGVNDVVNQLVVDHVVASHDPDEALAARVTKAFQRDGRVSPADVHVECVKGDVHLFGYVESIDDQNAAIEVARSVPGVRRVFSGVVITDRTSLGLAEREHGEGGLGRP